MKHIHCPVNGWDCPYYTDKGHPCRCLLEDPFHECDDFAAMWDEGDDWLDDDWDACGACEHFGDMRIDDVSFCACCETANFFCERSEESELW